MKKGQVLFIAEKGFREVFDSLSLKGEVVRMLPAKDVFAALDRDFTDLLVLDCGPDTAKGTRVLREIKAVRPDIPVIFIADDCFRGAADAFRAGAREYLCKPVDIFELQETAGALLRIKRSPAIRHAPLMLKKRKAFVNGRKAATSDKPLDLLMVIRYIEENLDEEITLDTLAKKAGFSKYHFCRYFSKFTGMPPIRFVNFRRVERAKDLIGKGSCSLPRLAVHVGFNRVATFKRQFMRFTGLMPEDYLESVRENLHY